MWYREPRQPTSGWVQVFSLAHTVTETVSGGSDDHLPEHSRQNIGLSPPLPERAEFWNDPGTGGNSPSSQVRN